MFSKESFSNIFFENFDALLLTKLNNKISVTLATIPPEKNGEFNALIPLIEEELISYTSLFKLSDSNINYSLSVVVDSTSQDDLFKRIPIITDLITEFINQIDFDDLDIKNLYNQSEFQKLIRSVMETVDDLFLMDPLGYIHPKNSAFMQLITKLGKNAHMFFNSVLHDKKAVILANSQIDSFLLQYPWSNLVPKQNLKIKFWPGNVSKESNFDILIIEKNQKKQCNPDWSIFDLETGIVENGTSDDILKRYFIYLNDLNKGLGNILKISKLNPPLSGNDDVILSNFVLSDENSDEKEIYLVQTRTGLKTHEVIS